MIPQIIRAGSVPLAIIVVGLLAWQAMSLGINGAIFMSALAVIGGLGDYRIKTEIDRHKSKSPPEQK